MIFLLLPPRDVKNVVLVCRLWKEVWEAPSSLAWLLTRENLPEVLESRRIETIRRISLEEELPREKMEALLTGVTDRTTVGTNPHRHKSWHLRRKEAGQYGKSRIPYRHSSLRPPLRHLALGMLR